MWKPFVIIFIVTTNLCNPLDSYKLINDKSSKNIEVNDKQNFSNNPREEYIEENYSNEDSHKEFNGRVVIGKWRNNGEALEPKWRDGDSVPLAPFSAISFKSGWRRDPDSREEDYQIEPETFNEKGKKKNIQTFTIDEENRRSIKKPEEVQTGSKNRNGSNSGTENYHDNRRQGIRYKNSHRTERRFNGPAIDHGDDNSPEVIKPPGVLSRLRESLRKDDRNENAQGVGKYRETLENYPKEYELFENENDDPRPRKRRPPEHYEFPGPWSSDDNRRKGADGDDEQGEMLQSQFSNVANDFRRYTVTNQDEGAKLSDQTKSKENTELKTYLKMQGDNLSLSEILQQKNLTLADILRGKPNAINILKSNDKKSDSSELVEEISVKESPFTDTPETSLRNLTEKDFKSSPNREMMMKKSDENSTIDARNESDIFASSEKSIDFETTTSPITTTTFIEIEDTENNQPLFNTTRFIEDNETVSDDKLEQFNPFDDEKKISNSEEFLKPLENRESLVIEATTVVEDGKEYSSDDQQVSVSNDRSKLGSNNEDEDEIMEFSDYPAAKIAKFITPMRYETPALNTRRKNIPFSAIMRKKSPVPNLDSQSKSETSEKISESTTTNETNDVNQDSEKIVGEVAPKNLSSIEVNSEQEEKPEEKKNTMQHITALEKTQINSEPKAYENERKTIEKNVENDFIRDTNEFEKMVEVVRNDDRSNGNEAVPREEKDLTLNHKLHEVVIPKVDPQSRAEILELFSSGSSAERLERLLASRNMTIEELIALRQRGSSQVHFAEVFKAKEQSSSWLRKNLKTISQVPDNHGEHRKNHVEETTERIDLVKENNRNLSSIEDSEHVQSVENNSDNKKKDIFDSEGEYLTTDLIKLFSENNNLKNNVTSSSDQTNRSFDQTNRSFDTPVIKTNFKSISGMNSRKTTENSISTTLLQELYDGNNIQRDSEGSSYYTSIESVKLPSQEEEVKKISDIFRERKSGVLNSVSLEEIGRVEEILNNDLKTMKNIYGINDYEFSEKKALSKVKPSIIASGGILGVTIVVFLSIFIACRIRQKKKFAYKNSFAKAVFHNPVTNVRKLSNTSSVNTIMVDVVATSTTKRQHKHDAYESDDFGSKSDIDNDSLDANDSWDTIPDFMK